MKNSLKLLCSAAVGLALMASACTRGGTNGESDSGGGNLSGLGGGVNADGSSTVFPISQAVAEEFNQEAQRVKISVGTSGTGGGFKKFCAGEADIANASRPIETGDLAAQDEAGKKGEAGLCRENGVEFIELTVALDGLSILVNPSNTFAKCLTVEELKSVWAPDSKINNWNQIRPSFPSQPIALYGPGTDSGTFDYFTDAVVGEEGASRSDYVASEDDNVLVQGVAGDKNAFGYFGYAYYLQNKDKLKSVAVDGGDGCVQPTEKSIANGKYKPLSRPLFIYVSKKAASRKEVAAFVDFYFETVTDLVPAVGYIAQPKETLAEEIKKWETFKEAAKQAAA